MNCINRTIIFEGLYIVESHPSLRLYNTVMRRLHQKQMNEDCILFLIIWVKIKDGARFILQILMLH